MTVERHLVFEPADIRAITLECKKCGVRLTSKPTALDVPGSCPGAACSHVWWASTQRAIQERGVSPFESLSLALKTIESIKDDDAVGFRLLLEFDEPPRAS